MTFCRLRLPGFAALLLAVLLPHVQAQPVAEPDYLIYTDSLVNGWQNFSFKTVTASVTNPVHGGANALSVTTTGSFGALYVHVAGFDTTTYGSISFWINGGPTGGQLLQVFGVLKVNGTDTQQTSVTFSAPAANTWKQVTIPLSSLGVANKSNLTGFWIQNRVSTVQPLYYVDDIRLVAAAAPSSVSIAVNTAATVRTADARIFGVNTAIWDSRLNTTTTAALLTETGLRTLRFPGGSNSDSYHWATNKSDGNTWSWATNFDNFAQLAANSGSTAVYITVNYGSGTPTEAADWVTYSNVTKGYNFRYWEVGNEIYGSWENDTNSVPHDPFTYATRFKDYYNQMKARDPSIKIGAVVEVGEDAYANNTSHPATNPRTGAVHNGWTPVMLATLKSLGVTPDFAIHHKYPPNLGDAGLLQQAVTWAADTANLRQQLNDYLGTGTAAAVELVCTETNGPITNNNGVQSPSLITGLYYADSLGQVLQTEFNGCIWWDLRNGRTAKALDPTLYAWRPYSDGSMIFGAANATDRYPAFYVAKVTSHFAAGGDTIVSATSNYQRLSTFAARRADGSVSVLVINKHATATLTGSIAVAGTALAGRAVAYSYGIPQDEAARTGVGSPDISQSTISGVGAAFNRSFGPYSVTVLSLKPKLGISTTVLPADGTALVAYAQNLTAAGGATGGYGWTLAAGTLPPGVTLNSGGSLSGTPTTAGLYQFTAQAADTIGNTATQAFTITIANVPFALWLSQRFTAPQQSDPAVSGPAADPDHDGMPNLLEFALNRNPLTAGTPPVSVIELDPTDQENYLTLTYTRRKPPHDLTYHVEISADLVMWTEDPSLVQEQSVTDDGNGLTETVKVRAVAPVATATPPRQFLRLRVTQP